MKTCSLADQTILHASGLRTMPLERHKTKVHQTHVVDIPAACCPISGYPHNGSFLMLSYTPYRATLEVYTLTALVKQFVGGYPGSKCGTYPAERNMEGMITLLCRMAGDALGVDVTIDATCELGKDGVLLLSASSENEGTPCSPEGH